MNTRQKWTFLVALICVFLSGLSPEEKPKAGLPEKYKKWLEEEIVYIITPKERDVFRRLETDRERDIFTEAFWKHRDPTPGTPRNEFKEEHFRRLNYANEFFGRGTPRPGWMTDQGRVYIVLGPPQNIDKYDSIMNIFPTEVWFYLGDPAYGLPTGFHVIFFKKEGTGEYILYSPVEHGPQGLIADYMGDAKDDRAAYVRLAELAPNLAPQTLSLIPGERVQPGYASLASIKLLSDVFSYPQKKVEDTYAEALLKYKDVIEVDYSANYIGSDSFSSVIKDKAGFFLVHYSVEPKKISVDSYGNQFNTNFELDGRISDAKGNTVFQYAKEFPLSFTGEQLKDIGVKSLAMQDMFPLVPGTYRFDLLLKNTVSKEFSSLEETISIPAEEGAAFLSPLLLGYQVEKNGAATQDFIPFKTQSGQVLCQARKTFAKKETLYVYFQVLGLTPELRSLGQVRAVVFRQESKFLSQTKGILDYGDGPNILLEFPLGEFPPDYYKIRVSVLDQNGAEILTADEDFEVSTAAEIPRPLIISKVTPGSRAEEYDFMLGFQWFNLGRLTEAHALLEKAYQKNPAQLRYALGFSQVLYGEKEFKRVKDILSPFAGERATDQVLYFLGKSCHALEQDEETVAHCQNYLTRFGVNLEILNLLGMAYYRLGNSTEALAAWKKSLEINPAQEEIKKLVQSLEEKAKR